MYAQNGYGSGSPFHSGVGERARADARIILEGVKTEVFQQRTRESNYVVWQKQLNQGSLTETLTLPRFTGTVNTPFRAPGGISVQIPEGEFKSQIATLSQPFRD
jgi:filamentous hemagglutinin